MFSKPRTLVVLALTLALAPVTARAAVHAGARGIAYLIGEYTTGMTKQCIYDSLGNQYVRTVRAVDLCPLSIQVP